VAAVLERIADGVDRLVEAAERLDDPADDWRRADRETVDPTRFHDLMTPAREEEDEE
jgi:hypothetical protein